MPNPKHIHQYHRVDIGKNKSYPVYACADPYCLHYIHSERQIVGKASICWGCRQEFIIQRDSRGKLAKKPKCQDCIRKKAKESGLTEPEVRSLLEPPITDIDDDEDEVLGGNPDQDVPSVRKLLGLE